MRHLDAWRIVLLMLFLVGIGCGKQPKTTPTNNTPPTIPDTTRPAIGNYVPAAGRLVPENDLGQFALMYLAECISRPPHSLADLPEVRRDMPKAYPAFEDGRYVVAWGADPNHAPGGASRTVLAYEKAAPEKGGVVVFLDGSVRNVTAQEFQTFAKPGAK
jgi:hypothetical protein